MHADGRTAAAAEAAPKRRVGRHARRLVQLAVVLAVLGIDAALIAPDIDSDGASFGHVRWMWLAAAFGCEALSLFMFARLRRRLLRVGGANVPLRRMGVLTLAAAAISFTVPAGTAVSAGYLYRQLRREGASAALVAWTLLAATVVSVLAFSVLTMAGTVLAGGSSLARVLGAGGLSLVTVLVLIAGLNLVTHHPRPVVRAYAKLVGRLPCAPAIDVDRVSGQFAAITLRLRDWSAAFTFALLNWAGDLACFVLCCYAVGIHRLGIGVAVLAYVAGLATTSITVLPGGLGSMEAGMLIGLANAGVAGPLALSGVLIYRIVAYGLVAAVGWLAWAAVRRRFRVAPA